MSRPSRPSSCSRPRRRCDSSVSSTTRPPEPPSRGPSECSIFFFKQKTAYDLGLGIPAEPLFRSGRPQPLRGTKGKRKGARLWYVGGQQRRAPLRLPRSEERFSRNAETDLVCRLQLEKKKEQSACDHRLYHPT